MKWSGRRVLVTGAGGFIGSHLVERLVESGADVTAFLHYRSSGGSGLLEEVEPRIRSSIRQRAGDLRDFESVRRAVASHELVFHLGALVGIPYSYANPSAIAQTNILGTLNVLTASRDTGVARVVHTSTSEVYGSAQRVPIDERHPLAPQSPYAASKVAADALAASFQRSFGLPVVTVRPFNTYGPRQSGRAVIPAIAGQALHADRVRIGSLTPTRDFNYISDTVAGFLALAGCDAAIGREINLGSGTEVSVGEVAQKIIRLAGREVAVESAEERVRPRASEVMRLVADSSEAHALTGWATRVTLDEGLAHVIEFLARRPEWTRVGEYEI